MVTKKERAFIEQWGEMMYETGLLESPGEAREWIEETIEEYENREDVEVDELVERRTDE